MIKTKFLVFATLVVLLVTSMMASSAIATTIPTFTLSSSTFQLPFVLPQGTTFNGSISTSGPVRFLVSAPNGTVIINLGLIDKTESFSFVAQQTGNYTLIFENDLPNSVQVNFSYLTNPEIPGSNNSTPLSIFYLPIFIIIAVVGSILIVFIIRRRNQKLTN